MDILETAEDKRKRKRQIKVAMKALKKRVPFDLIADLRLSEVQLLPKGKDIDAEDAT